MISVQRQIKHCKFLLAHTIDEISVGIQDINIVERHIKSEGVFSFLVPKTCRVSDDAASTLIEASQTSRRVKFKKKNFVSILSENSEMSAK
jgi:hypothetical protein